MGFVTHTHTHTHIHAHTHRYGHKMGFVPDKLFDFIFYFFSTGMAIRWGSCRTSCLTFYGTSAGRGLPMCKRSAAKSSSGRRGSLQGLQGGVTSSWALAPTSSPRQSAKRRALLNQSMSLVHVPLVQRLHSTCALVQRPGTCALVQRLCPRAYQSTKRRALLNKSDMYPPPQ